MALFRHCTNLMFECKYELGPPSSMHKVPHGTTCCSTPRDHCTEAGPADSSSPHEQARADQLAVEGREQGSIRSCQQERGLQSKGLHISIVILQFQGFVQFSVKSQGRMCRKLCPELSAERMLALFKPTFPAWKTRGEDADCTSFRAISIQGEGGRVD